MPALADRNLLLGLLALQNNFVSREALVGAFGAWVANRSQSLTQLLLDDHKIKPSQIALLNSLVSELLDQAGSPDAVLAAVSHVEEAIESLQDDGDKCVNAGPRKWQDEQRSDATLQPRSLGATAEMDRGGRFHILRPHAEGGLGRVWVARDEELNREVALKEMKPQFNDEESRLRFLREAEITGGLEHPGIVPVYGLGREGDQPYYAMRFIKGDSMQAAVDSFHATKHVNAAERNLALRRLIYNFLDVCEAIDYAHSRSVLHRDLKPANIMLGKYGETLVVDWGLARPIGAEGSHHGSAAPSVDTELPLSLRSGDGTSTEMGRTVGTPAFMPPEQAAGRWDILGPAADVYSLGATLYAIVTGKPPVAGTNVGEVLKNVQEGRIIPPRQRVPSIPKSLEAICLKALAFEPGDRYTLAHDLHDDLELWLADEPVSAYRENRFEQTKRWLRRNQTLATTLAVTIFVGVTAGLGIVIIADEADQEVTAVYKLSKEQRDYQLARLQMTEEASDQADAVAFQGDHLLTAGRFNEAEQSYQAALATNRTIADMFSDDPLAHRDVAITHLRLARVRQKKEEWNAALVSVYSAEHVLLNLHARVGWEVFPHDLQRIHSATAQIEAKRPPASAAAGDPFSQRIEELQKLNAELRKKAE